MAGQVSIRAGLVPAISGIWDEVRFLGGPAAAIWDQTSDGAHSLYLEDLGNGQVRFAWDGDAGKPFELIPQHSGDPFVWSPDGRRVAYYGRRDTWFFVGVDGTEMGPYEGVTRSVPPTFSSDGSRLAFGIDTRDGFRVVLDDEVLEKWQPAPRAPVFSPDGTRFAFAAENFKVERGQRMPGDYRQWIVLDGVAQPEGIGIPTDPSGVQFSPDGRRFLYAQVVDGGVRLVVDGSATEPFADIGFAAFSPDSRRLAYAAGPKDHYTFFDDGVRRGNAYWRIGGATFSPDSARLGFFAFRSKGHGVAVIDGVEGPEFDDFWGLVEFSPDSRRAAYLASATTGGFLSRSTTVRLVLDGQAGEAWDEVRGNAHFSPDSRRVAFPARRAKAWHMVVDGQPGTGFADVGPARFGASGRLAYLAHARDGKTERYRVIAEGIETPWMDAPTELKPGETFLFSPDGEHIATVGRFGTEWRPVVDDRIGPGGAGAGAVRFGGDGASAIVSGPRGGMLQTSTRLEA